MTRVTTRSVVYGTSGTEIRTLNGKEIDRMTKAFATKELTVSVRDDVRKSKRLADSYWPPLPYSAVITEPAEMFSTVDYERQQYSYKYRMIGSRQEILSFDLNAPLVSSSQRNRAITKMLQKLADQKLDLAVSILEAREGVQLVGQTAKTIHKAMLFASAKRWSRVASTLGVPNKGIRDGTGTVADGWLTYSFGWAPMVSDAAKIAAWLATPSVQETFVIRVASGVPSEVKGTSKVHKHEISDFYASSVRCTHTVTYSDRHKTDYKVGCYYKLDGSRLRDLNQLGLLNAPAVVWARVPFSFVADWFVSFGDFLEVLSADVGLTFLTGFESTFRATDRTLESVSFSTNLPSSKMSVHSKDFVFVPGRAASFVRTVLNESPLPSGLFVKDPFDMWKAVTATALLRQFMSK